MNKDNKHEIRLCYLHDDNQDKEQKERRDT